MKELAGFLLVVGRIVRFEDVNYSNLYQLLYKLLFANLAGFLLVPVVERTASLEEFGSNGSAPHLLLLKR
jgi:hypothetical protein